MNNFQKIGDGLNTIPLLLAIKRRPELWNQNKLRTTHPATPHKQVSDIWLRFNELPEAGEEERIMDEHESIDYPAYAMLPEARQLVMNLMHYVGGERLGRVLITSLPPGGIIDPHVDGGSHAEYYDRFHIVLQSQPGSIFIAGEEQVSMHVGEVWWFDNSKEHSVINNSADDRIHLICDIRTLK